MASESILLRHKHILICIDEQLTYQTLTMNKEIKYIKTNFCGIVFSDIKSFNDHDYSSDSLVYLCGDIMENYNKIQNIPKELTNVIENLSYNYTKDSGNYNLVNIGQIPVNIHNVGVYFRNFFDSNKNYFNSINNEHQFQALTESNKPSDAFRTGIYLTKVEEINNEIKFSLLRCSSNLHGPSDNFRNTDNEIINQVNNIAEYFFHEKAQLNHVLAQIYKNKIINTETKNIEKKAKIKEHADKTKDMPKNGLIAFCTFYKDLHDLTHIKKSSSDFFDYRFNNVSVLTKIRFRLKKTVTDTSLIKMFDIILYPNSVFLISLLTNRLYTHEIIPSTLRISQIPVRMGYVIRCSKTEAVFKNNQTYINENGIHIKLEESTEVKKKELKDLYFKENITDEIINYGKFYFSLNNGDYEKPIV